MNSGDFRDRTDEFNSIAECVKRQTTSQNTGDSKKGTNGTVTTTQGRSQFSIIATSIGRDIHRTSEKIARLTERKEHLFFLFTHTLLKKKKKSKHFFYRLVTKRTSLFDEQTVAPQIQRLIGEVNADLNDMKKRLEVLTAEADHIKQEQRGQHQLSDHASTVVSCLQNNIFETTSNFRAVLQIRTNVKKKKKAANVFLFCLFA